MPQGSVAGRGGAGRGAGGRDLGAAGGGRAGEGQLPRAKPPRQGMFVMVWGRGPDKFCPKPRGHPKGRDPREFPVSAVEPRPSNGEACLGVKGRRSHGAQSPRCPSGDDALGRFCCPVNKLEHQCIFFSSLPQSGHPVWGF